MLRRVTGRTLRPGGLTLTRNAVEISDFNQNDTVLDAGCGYGMTTRYLYEEYGLKAVGMDVSPDMLARAREKTPGGLLIQSKMPVLPFKSHSFNGIFCECVLSLVPDKKTCLDEFYRVLKKDGKLIISDLYVPQLHEPAISRTRMKNPGSCLDGAVTAPAMAETIESAGFTIDLFKDHTRLLKQMAGQMVFEYGSLNRFWDAFSGAGCGTVASAACRSGLLKPGYCMIIARKHG